MSARLAVGLLLTCLLAFPRGACALITGGEGNAPVRDPGWPAGAAAIFNAGARVAWWEGPPFGGGQWHAEYRGDAAALNAFLADFARLDVKVKRVVVHDGDGQSFWLNPNGQPDKRASARIDWSFAVWQPDRWERLRAMPTDLNPTDPADASPPAQVDVYAGALRWGDVNLPQGLGVVDQRLEAHGFTPADGVVLEGKAVDLATGQPVAATARLERVEPREDGRGYHYTAVAEAKEVAGERWVLKNVPAGWFRVVVEADGYVPRVAGYVRPDGHPRWHSYDRGLARPAAVSGRVTDADDHPLAGVEVQFADVQAGPGGRYDLPHEPTVTTDTDGRFRADQLPAGKATVWVRKPGYCRPGLGLPVTTPADGISLRMVRSAVVRVTVNFAGKARPGGYIVSLAPEGGEVVGSHGGSAELDPQNQAIFREVPPGRYVLRGRPNPGSDAEQTEPVPVTLEGGNTAEVTLNAR